MSQKRIEFLNSLDPNQTRDEGNIYFAARLESERIEREKREAAHRGNLFLAKKVEAEYQRRKAEEGRSL